MRRDGNAKGTYCFRMCVVAPMVKRVSFIPQGTSLRSYENYIRERGCDMERLLSDVFYFPAKNILWEVPTLNVMLRKFNSPEKRENIKQGKNCVLINFAR